ncbi:MAG: hypothetical protein R6W85_07220 [Gillisia sp.]
MAPKYVVVKKYSFKGFKRMNEEIVCNFDRVMVIDDTLIDLYIASCMITRYL